MNDSLQLMDTAREAMATAIPWVTDVSSMAGMVYGIVQDLMPMFVLLLFLMMLRANRQFRDIARRQEQQTRVLVKLLNLHPDSDYQQFLRVAEKRAEERDKRRQNHPDLLG